MKCPFCGNEMKEGTLHSGGRYVQWKGVDAEGRKSDSGYRAILSIFVGFSGRLKTAL